MLVPYLMFAYKMKFWGRIWAYCFVVSCAN